MNDVVNVAGGIVTAADRRAAEIIDVLPRATPNVVRVPKDAMSDIVCVPPQGTEHREESCTESGQHTGRRVR